MERKDWKRDTLGGFGGSEESGMRNMSTSCRIALDLP